MTATILKTAAKPRIQWIDVNDTIDEWTAPVEEDVLYQFNVDPLA